MANFNHNNRNHGYRGRGRKNNQAESHENDQNKENREQKNGHDQQEARAMFRERRERENRERRENKENRDNQVIKTFTLGTKELEGKNVEFQYDKGWYSIWDIVGEEKTVVYKSKNAQEAYTKWNVYIGRKKERPQRADKAEN